MNDREVLTVADAAQWMQISKNKVYELVAQEESPCFRDELIACLKRLQTDQRDE